MKLKQSTRTAVENAEAGHTLVEVMMSMGLLGFVMVSLYSGFSWGFAALQISRENLRATQIMAERMEVIRVIRWGDVLADGFIPTTFAAPFDAKDETNSSAGLWYYGTVTRTNVPLAYESYTNDLRMVRIDLKWKSGNVERLRSMTTYISRYGKQNYIY